MSLTDYPWATLPAGDDPADAYGIDVRRYWRDVLRTRTARIVLALALAGVVLLLAACKPIPPGVVTSRWTTQLGGQTHYNLSMRGDDGQKYTRDVPAVTWWACSPGERVPDCGK